jgi:predicted nucleic acid-binding protein
VDTSCLVAIAFAEPAHRPLAARLQRFDRLLSSNLLEAELRAALVREGIGGDADPVLSWITWVYPNRPLTLEFRRITSLAYLRGADLWHLACALFLAPRPERLAFLTLDRKQREVASKLGFLP